MESAVQIVRQCVVWLIEHDGLEILIAIGIATVGGFALANTHVPWL